MERDAASTATYVFVWLGVMGLALASFLLSLAHLGQVAPAVALSIAVIKATLIAAFFMHLAEQPSISRWAFGLGIALAALLLLMVAVDVLTREHTGLRQPGLASTGPADDRNAASSSASSVGH